MAALIDSTDVNLFLRINASIKEEKRVREEEGKECAPLALDRGDVVRVVGESRVH